MNPETFIESFGYVADAPGGIDKLRALILDLAVRGRLTRQDPNDEPASELLNRIRAERDRMVTTAEIRKPKDYPTLVAKDIPYDLPSGWEWARAVDLLYTVNGRAFKPTDWTTTGRPIIRIQNLNRADAPYNHYDGDVEPRFLIEPGDLLISWSGTPGTSFGAFVWHGPSGILNQHIFRCQIFGDYRDYVCKAVNSRLDVLIDDAHGGVGLQHFTKDKLERLPLPVPPLAEQQRIVEQVDQLLALCDKLETQQNARKRTRVGLTKSTLGHLAAAETPDGLRDDVRLFTDNIDHHLAPGSGDFEALKELRRTILDLAVSGGLARQDPNDEPASELLARIRTERARLVLVKEIRAPKAQSDLDDGLVAQPLPSGWQWARFGDVILETESGWSPRCEAAPAAIEEWGVLKLSAVSWGVFNELENKQLLPGTEPRPKLEVRPGDFLMTRSNTQELVGRSVVVHRTRPRLMISDLHIRVRFSAHVDLRFMNIVNNSPTMARYYAEISTGTSSSMQKVSRGKIRDALIALPPLEEQRRIVDRVEQLAACCDELEDQFTAAEACRRDLAESVVRHAVDLPAPNEVLA